MNKVTYGIIAVIIFALGGGLLLAGSNDGDEMDSFANPSTSEEAQQRSSDASENLDEAEEIALESTGASGLQEYSAEALAASETEDNLIFFHASWCTICESVRRNIEAGSVPDDLSIFQLDYDSDLGRELARKYEIGPQYTMVQVNPDGSEIQQWVNQFGDGIDDINGRLL